MNLINANDPVVVINTNYGAIFVELYQGQAPNTVANFLSYVNQGFYTNTLIHRVDLSNQVVQGGGYQVVNSTLQAKTTSAPIAMENTGYKNTLGSIGMARTSDPNSATSQFYFNLTDNPGFDGNGSTTGYTVFGAVVSGWNVVQSMSQAERYVAPNQTLPYTLVNVLSASVYNNPSAANTDTSYRIATVTDLGNTSVVVLTGKRADFSVVGNSDGSLDIQNITGNYASVHVTSADRLVFYNATSKSYGTWLAYDLQGDAGKVAELIGTAFGRGYLNVTDYVRLGLQFLEQNKMSVNQLCDLVVGTSVFQQLAGSTSNSDFVNLVYKNVVGQAPDAGSLAYYKGLLDNQTYTQGQLLELASHYVDPTIDLVGLSHTGIQFG